MNKIKSPGLFKTPEAAAYLGVSDSALRQGRMNGTRERRCPTPPYIKIGRAIRYRIEDLDRFLEEHRIDPGCPTTLDQR